MSLPNYQQQSYGSYPAQSYSQYSGQYSPPAPYSPEPGQYTSQGGHYPSQIAQFPPQYTLPAPPYPPPKLKSSPPPPEPLPSPDLSSVSSVTASKAIQRLISAQLRTSGFDSAEPHALQTLEHEVVAFVSRLYELAHEYANLANRVRPIAKDLLLASQECGLETDEVNQVVKKSRKRSREGDGYDPVILVPASPPPPSPELLPSDDEGTPTVIPATLRALPYTIPELPPKHTYLKTPPSPPKKAAPSSLDKKLKNAGLVQESLKNLLLATEDTTGQEDGELLGHIVNWEAHVYPRKRWKFGA